MPLLECVPNVSEGRRAEVLDRLRAAAGSVPGAHLLDLSADPDHNRAVLTLAGEADPLERAVLSLVGRAVADIDLRRHAGVHPRAGAVDVIPFVPLDRTPMEEAVEAARRVGREIAERHRVPVYLYAEAATRPGRRDLAVVRRGGFEGFAAKLLDQGWAPDFGPARLHPSAGVTAVGARFFLIAFNALLDTDDIERARAVARRVRESSGGLPAVKAIGVFLASRGRAQVSMNLVDYRTTSPARALEAVEHEARLVGTRVLGSEIVGLVPEAALADAGPEELRLERFSPDQLLERRLEGVGLTRPST